MMSLQLIHCKIWLSNVLSTLHFDCYGLERSGLKIVTEAAATAVVVIAAAAVVIVVAVVIAGNVYFVLIVIVVLEMQQARM